MYYFVEKNFRKKIKTTTTDFQLLFQGCRLPIEPWESPFLSCFVYIPIIPLFAAEFVMKTSVEPTELASHEMMAIRWFLYHFIGPNCSNCVQNPYIGGHIFPFLLKTNWRSYLARSISLKDQFSNFPIIAIEFLWNQSENASAYRTMNH